MFSESCKRLIFLACPRRARKRTVVWVSAFLCLGLPVVLGGQQAPQQQQSSPMQQAPPEIAGRLQGEDISVENGPSAAPAGGLPGMPVANGTIIVVHSGQARLTLVNGGELDICGPAKFTFLETDGAITVALDFGRVHGILQNSLPLKIFTPMVQATPEAIAGGQRDFTLGLATTDALCVRTTQGAIRLEEQFTSQDVVVPQAGEFMITGGTLAPVPGPPGSCACDVARESSTPPAQPPVVVTAAPPTPKTDVASATPQPNTSLSSPPDPDAPAQMPWVIPQPPKQQKPLLPAPAPFQPPQNDSVEYSVPTPAPAPAHPVAPAPAKEPPREPPPVKQSTWSVVMPPLVYSAGSPAPPPPPSAESMLLIRESQVEPEWVFNGKVSPPSEGGQPGPLGSTSKSAKKKHGFWSRLRSFF
jgi:hypothetical protein